jgi:hypothetical protein
MPDISMCLNKTCPLRDKCYRYLAHPSEWQSVGDFKPNEDGTSCDHFWDVTGHKARTVEDVERLNIYYSPELDEFDLWLRSNYDGRHYTTLYSTGEGELKVTDWFYIGEL